MKTIVVSLTALVALTIAPIASQAADKEVQNARHCKACCRHQQVALFVSGRGVGNQPTTATQSVTKAQTGQGTGVTFFTSYPGER
jgi:hypothetical protein